MVVIKDFLVYCRQEMKNELWDDESVGDEGIEAGIIEDLDSRGAALMQMAGIRDVAGNNDVFAKYDDDDNDDGEAELYLQQYY
jgi:hypothetical protein